MLWIFVWLGIACACAILEFCTMQMVSIWCVAGALVAMLLAGVGVGLEIQWIVFLVLSIALLLSLRNICLKSLLKNKNEKTNVDAFTGKECKLLKGIAFEQSGEIRLNGVIWTAIAENEEAEIPEGSIVVIKKLNGNKVIVAKKEQ